MKVAPEQTAVLLGVTVKSLLNVTVAVAVATQSWSSVTVTV